jgi:hypothetical protein
MPHLNHLEWRRILRRLGQMITTHWNSAAGTKNGVGCLYLCNEPGTGKSLILNMLEEIAGGH